MSDSVYEDGFPKASLAIAERFSVGLNYLYPLLLNVSRKHRIVRDALISAMFDQQRLFYEAAKSGQASKVYIADAGLAHIKELLRFMAEPSRKLVSRRQYEVASVHFAETGNMLGGWIRHAQKR
jgi:hypothetical protein